MKKNNNKLNMFVLLILGVFLFSINVEAKNCKDGGCPCVGSKDPGYWYAEVIYKDEETGQDLTDSLENWLKNSEKGDKGFARFFYTAKSSYKYGSRVEITKITRTNSSRQYKCPGVSSRKDLSAAIIEESEKKDTLENYNCELFEQKDVYSKFIEPAYIVIRIITPILVIIMGVKDLVGAVVSQKAEDMQKAQKSLVTRVIIGVIIMILPTIIDALMNLAGITYGTCGIG